MARKAEPGISYYYTSVNMILHDKIKLLYADFDSHGPWVFNCLLSEIYKRKGYFIDVANKDTITLFASDVAKKPVSLVNEIIAGCIRRDLFDKDVFNAFKVLTSDRIQETYIEATSERRRKGTAVEIREELLLVPAGDLQGQWKNIVLLPNNLILPRKNDIVPQNNPESKVKESKVKESTTNAHARDRLGYLYEDFISDFNLLTKRSYVGDSKSKGYFNARLKEGFTREQFKRAISNCMADRYHVETNLQHLTPEFILRQDKLQKFLNTVAGTVSISAASENPFWNYCPNTWDADFYNRIKSENLAARKVAAYEQKLKKNGYRKVGDGWEKAA